MVSKDVNSVIMATVTTAAHSTIQHAHILYKTGPGLYMTDLLSHHNHTENKDQKVAGMSISIHTFSTAIDVPLYTSIKDIINAMSIDAELQMLQPYILRGWPQDKDDLESTPSGY